MRIALNALFLQYAPTGTGRYTRRLLDGLRAAGHDVHAVAPWGTPSDGIVEAGFPLLPAGNMRKLWFEQVAMPRAGAGCAVIHYPYFAGPLYAPAPVVMTIHDVIPLIFPEYQSPLVRAYNRLIVAAARRAAAIIADSEHSRHDIVTIMGIPPDRVHVVYLAADEGFAEDAGSQRQSVIRQRYGLPSEYILYTGGLSRHKNVEMLLRSFARALPAMDRPCTLVIAGEVHGRNPAIFPDLHAIAARLGPRLQAAVRFLGRVPDEDLPALYSGAMAFVYPSRYEGFGLPPLEAMACGVPVICSRAASLPEVVGDAAWLVDPDDEQALAEALLRLLSDEQARNDLRRRCLAQAKRFSWASTIRATVAVYERVAR